MRRPESIGSTVVKLAFLLALAVGVDMAAVPSQAVPALFTLSGRIPLKSVQGRIDHMAVDTAGHRLFVAALGNNSVEIFDVSDASGNRRRRSLDTDHSRAMASTRCVCEFPDGLRQRP